MTLAPYCSLTVIIFALWLTFVISCKDLKNEKTHYSYTLDSTDTLSYDSILVKRPTVFGFKNNSEGAQVSFSFYQKNGINYRDASAMLASVIDKGMSDEQKAIAIWKLAALGGFSYPFDYDHRLQDNVDPMALVRFPYFLCGEKSGIVSNLAILAGLDAHCVSLDGHVVAEIKYNGSWHMFDANENCIFRNQEGQIVSAEDLHKHLDWITEKNMEWAIKNNFFRFKRYKKYFNQFDKASIDTSCIIYSYPFPNGDITLYPQDEVEFHLMPTSLLTRLFHPRYLFDTRGILKRKINEGNLNVRQVNDHTFSFNEEFPYYLKQLEIFSQTPVDVKVYFHYENRETLKTEKEFLGNLNKQNSLIKKITAPSKPDIYYRYQIEFENLSADNMKGITIQHQFEFNSLAFPLHKSGNKVIAIDSTGHTNILFQIRKDDQ